MKKIIAFLSVIQFSSGAIAQDMKYIKQMIAGLSSSSMAGRGYAGNGRERAAGFLLKQYGDIGLTPFYEDGHVFQLYRFPVNTFTDVRLKLGKKELNAGADFLVDAGSISYHTDGRQKMERVDLSKVRTEEEWDKIRAGFSSFDIYLLTHTDTLCRRLNIRMHELVDRLPRSCYIIPQAGKLTWTVATDTINAAVFYVADSSMPKGKKVEAVIRNKFVPAALSKNIVAYVPGTEVKDSFIVFTAHYDHLGRMGRKAVFFGANDNASGTAFMLAMARYFKAHPQKYSIAFIAFSGEEAGLKGSRYYTEHPVFPLARIKCLVNIDLMGDATDGITVVNAVKEQASFDLLNRINAAKNYLPKIVSRDNAPNSDHYPFTQAGVPAIFIYANGGKGYYHDIWDRAKELSLRRIEKVGQLLIDFTAAKCAQ